MTAMKEKVATRTAAQDMMKNMWVLAAIKTEKEHVTCEFGVILSNQSHSKTAF